MSHRFYENVSLGILAGGRGSRLNNADKAFVRYQNEYLCQRVLAMLDIGFNAQLISAREADARYLPINLEPVFDTRAAFSGPLAGIEALLAATQTDYLLTIPVDIKYLPRDLITHWLEAPTQPGLVLRDGDSLQPLFALWHVRSSLSAVSHALDQHEQAVHTVISDLNFKIVTRSDIQIGNLNTPQDLEST